MLTLHIAGLRIFNDKSVIVMSWNIVRGRRTTVPVLEWWDTVDYSLERKIIIFRCFFQQLWLKNIVPAAKRVGADLLEFAVPEFAEFISGRKNFKTAAMSVGRHPLRKQ